MSEVQIDAPWAGDMVTIMNDNAPRPRVPVRPTLDELVRNAIADAELEGFTLTREQRERVRAALERLPDWTAPDLGDR